MRRLMLFGLALGVAACSNDATPRATNEAAATGEQAAPSEPAAIPAKFRGIWAEGRAACAQLSHPSRLIISERVIRYPSLVLIGESIDLPTDGSFAAKGYNQRTGAPAEAHFSIDATGNVLTDEAGGGAVRTSCG